MNIIELAKEAGFDIEPNVLLGEGAYVDGIAITKKLERFAALVRAESAKEDLEVLENLRKETIAQCQAGMIEAYQLGRAEALAEQQDKPEECAYGCPENMVCDYCQGAEPVKHEVHQEPVAWVDAKKEGYEFHGIGYLPVGKHHLYAAPVDAKAILEMRDKAFQSYVDQAKADRELSVLQARLEALEEAAKVCDKFCLEPAFHSAAAIRSLCQKTDKGGLK